MQVDGENHEVDEVFKYLEVISNKRGLCDKEMGKPVIKVRKVAEAMKALDGTKGLNPSGDATRCLHKGVLIPALICSCKTLVWHEYEKSRVRAGEMDMLKHICRVRKIDRISNSDL